MITCPRCQTQNDNGVPLCMQCGAPLTSDQPASRFTLGGDTRPLGGDTRPLGGDTRPLGSEGPTRPMQTIRVPMTSVAEDETTLLPELAVAFAPLPAGALVNHDRYEVLELWSESEALNLYLAAGGDPFIVCPSCDTLLRAENQKTCSVCNASLTRAPLLTATFVLKETREAAKLAAETSIAALKLNHPGLIAPVDAFNEMPYGVVTRHYVVTHEPPPLKASDVSVPQELPQVLDWGLQLSRALSYLHEQRVAFNQITGQHVALAGKRALWMDFSTSKVFPIHDQNISRSAAGDVEDLARLLLYMLTGQTVFTPDLALPGAVQAVFQNALTGAGFDRAEQLANALETALAEVRRPSGIDLRLGRLSDVGQVRQLNEDSLLTIEVGRVSRSTSRPLGLYAVADGMGGHAAGDVASRLIVDTLAKQAAMEFLYPVLSGDGGRPLDLQAWLLTAVQSANRAVFEQRRISNTDMGSTLVVALLDGPTARIANVGDSRCYLINAREIRRLTVDHSLVERLVATGQLTPAEARHHPQKNVIYRTIGDRPQVEADIFVQNLDPGDRLLLCSDGLSGMLEDREIQRLVLQASSPQEACRGLIAAANANGGDDNITAVVLQIEAAEQAPAHDTKR